MHGTMAGQAMMMQGQTRELPTPVSTRRVRRASAIDSETLTPAETANSAPERLS